MQFGHPKWEYQVAKCYNASSSQTEIRDKNGSLKTPVCSGWVQSKRIHGKEKKTCFKRVFSTCGLFKHVDRMTKKNKTRRLLCRGWLRSMVESNDTITVSMHTCFGHSAESYTGSLQK